VKTREDRHVLGRRAAGADGLRVVLAGAHSLRAMLGQPQPPPSLAWLRERTDQACELARAGRHDHLTEVLADLLPALEAAVRAGPPARHPELNELLAVAYQCCSAALAQLNEPDAAWIAADRAMTAAEQAGNLLLVAAGAQRLTSVFLGARYYSLGEETAATTVSALQDLAGLGDPDAVAVCGGLTLLRAVIAARSGRAAAAYRQLAYARRLAARLDPERPAAEFGPAHVTLYEIAVSVDLGDAGHALRVAAAAQPAGLPPDHRARMLIDVARAHALRDQAGPAADALARAESLCPAYVRDSDRARQLVRELLAGRPPVPPALSHLAARLGTG
jgi:hypothetical protein